MARSPIRHLVVIFQENRSFNHYFATYPKALNPPGESPFHAKRNTPTINGLSLALKTNNQNLAQPFRLGPNQAATCNPDHEYTALQEAMHAGLMDQFVQTTGSACPDPKIVMGYFDGNTTTALWNYAQHFAMSDNFHVTTITPSTPGHINLISGNTHGATPDIKNTVVQGTLINDVDPKYDKCSKHPTVELIGRNIGNLLNDKKITYGWFQGGFSDCSKTHIGANGGPTPDYVPHHSPFQYYQSTSNPNHSPPSSSENVGYTDQANHIYDLKDFWAAAKVGNVPAVSFFKAPGYQNEHAGNSSPLSGQEFIVKTVNRLQKLPQWKHMAVIITYDDSGGWYDFQMPPIINQSQIPQDALVSPGSAGDNPPLGNYQGRPAYGFRAPFLIVSPYAKENYVDSTLTDQTSILRFIEDNWDLGRIGDFSFDEFASPITQMFDFNCRRKDRLFLNPKTGEIVR